MGRGEGDDGCSTVDASEQEERERARCPESRAAAAIPVQARAPFASMNCPSALTRIQNLSDLSVRPAASGRATSALIDDGTCRVPGKNLRSESGVWRKKGVRTTPEGATQGWRGGGEILRRR